MTDPTRKAEQFRGLHVPGRPLVLFNIWDAGGAKAVAGGGVKAIATGSWSVANANGFADGELLPLRLANVWISCCTLTLKLREQLSVAGEVLTRWQAPIGH